MLENGFLYSLIAFSCFAVAACGGGSSGSAGNPSATGSTTSNNATDQGPTLADTVHSSYTLVASASAPNDTNAVVTINKDGILGVFGVGADLALTIPAGAALPSGSGKAAAGTGSAGIREYIRAIRVKFVIFPDDDLRESERLFRQHFVAPANKIA